ncbi:MAG TPA: nucleotidyltransferase domain-containing protein [Spirochaetia bacterium]|nr:nucleotidyltransferase domain-containing protein [Spirochaetia bacterium]
MLERTLSRFTLDMRQLLGQNLLEVIIHGSVVLGDFRPGRGDIDYVVITKDDLDEEVNQEIFRIHDRYRGSKELLLYQLEGPFYPRRAVMDLGSAFMGCYIGTTRRYWRAITSFQNSLMDLAIIDRYGRRMLGTATPLYRPSSEEIHAEQVKDCGKLAASMQGREAPSMADFVSTIHWCARTIHYLRGGQIVSKGTACRWCHESPELDSFGELFEYAQERRYPYEPRSADPAMVGACRALLDKVGRLLG